MALERVDHLVRRVDRLVDELVELVAVHEVREVGGRLPERHRIVATDGAKQRIGGQVLAHIAGGDGRRAPAPTTIASRSSLAATRSVRAITSRREPSTVRFASSTRPICSGSPAAARRSAAPKRDN